jgi:hypothetical protein
VRWSCEVTRKKYIPRSTAAKLLAALKLQDLLSIKMCIEGMALMIWRASKRLLSRSA